VKKQAFPPEIDSPSLLTVRASIRGLLNSFFREIGVYDIRCGGAESWFLPQDGAGIPFAVELPNSRRKLIGKVLYFSNIGQHRYGDLFYLVDQEGKWMLAETEQVIDAVLEEVSSFDTSERRNERFASLKMQIDNSMRNMNRYLEASMKRSKEKAGDDLDYVGSEQSLLLGHPFHPTPKSAEGFLEEELANYAPELQASFRLRYFAVAQEHVEEEWLDGYEAAIPSDVTAYAVDVLSDRAALYKLLPVHPWQAEYVLRDERLHSLQREQKLIDLGELGAIVYPTSSVRTVWSPEMGFFFKLPLHVRITNFVRENTPEQVRRTMDAAKVVQQASLAAGIGEPQIMLETGYRTLQIGSEGSEDLAASLAVVFRRAEQLTGDVCRNSFVVASLLEDTPEDGLPKLGKAVRQSLLAGETDPVPEQWLRAYLQISLLPLLRLFADTGISLEAHVQNSVVELHGGMPVRFYVRDLEGASVDRELADTAGWTEQLIRSDSPVLYTEAEAWLRLQYYFVVNHLGGLVPQLARHHGMEELQLWKVVRAVLQEERTNMDGSNSRLSHYIDELLTKDGLPAKANLISRFQERGETPLYVDVPNPIQNCKEEL
jgi:siderophore synthetase component